jgi:zinc protease
VTRSELDVAKRYLTRSHSFAVDTAAKRAALAADQALYDLPAGYHDDYVEHVRSVTLEEVNAAVKNRLTPSDLLGVVVGTESQIGDAVRKAIPGLASTEIVPFDGDI